MTQEQSSPEQDELVVKFDEPPTPEQQEEADVLYKQYKQILIQAQSLYTHIGQEFGGYPDPAQMTAYRLEALIEAAWPLGTAERLAFETNWQRKCVGIFKSSIEEARKLREQMQSEQRKRELLDGVPGAPLPSQTFIRRGK